ncbi:MAG: GNAT family N-acetyltransferase [Pseudomonadales bacterium]|nr:GNAT family N-acetyltransferase [Pseudomonadales bacterium]
MIVAVWRVTGHHRIVPVSPGACVIEMDRLFVEPLRESQARAIMAWRYDPPYDFYDPPDAASVEIYVREFLRPELAFHAVLDASGEFVGFCSFGRDGQVPGFDYDDKALDIGLGMKPALTGQGYGAAFFAEILRFAIGTFGPSHLRVTVAEFNKRAMALYRRFGFEHHSAFLDRRESIPYAVMVREADPC